MTREVHITSAIVQVRPEAAAAVRAQLTTLAGVEVHAEATGKIVVTLETPDERVAMDLLTEIRAMPGTIDAAMVYHGIDSAEENAT